MLAFYVDSASESPTCLTDTNIGGAVAAPASVFDVGELLLVYFDAIYVHEVLVKHWM